MKKDLNFNQKYRAELHSKVEEGAIQGITGDEVIQNYASYLYYIENEKSILIQTGRKYLLTVAFLDAFKIYSHHQKENTNGEADEEMLGILYDIEDMDDLIATVSAEPSFLVKILTACNQFAEMNDLGKITIQKSLSPLENEWLLENFPCHVYDIETYDIPINLSFLINALQSQEEYQRNVICFEFAEGIILSIYGFLRNLIKSNYQNAMELLLEIGKVDYACSKFLAKHLWDESLQSRVNFYEQSPMELILSRLMNDQAFLRSAIISLRDVFVRQTYDNIDLAPETIYTKDTEKVRKKLNLDNID